MKTISCQGDGEQENPRKAMLRLEAVAGKLGQLNARQQKAAALILTGCALGEVAQRAGVSRKTVYNWTHRDERFMSALERWKRDMAEAARLRLLGLSGMGYKAIAQALDRGDAKLALALFKGLGVLGEGGGKKEVDEAPRVIWQRVVEGGRS